MQFTYCPHPACCALAEILDRFTLQSTDGPVEHVRVLCLNRHRFALPVDSLPSSTVDTLPIGERSRRLR